MPLSNMRMCLCRPSINGKADGSMAMDQTQDPLENKYREN